MDAPTFIQNFQKTTGSESESPTARDQKNNKWLQERIQLYKPENVLREHAMITWFRTRRSRDTKEDYLHSGEQLKQKKIVK